MRRCAFFIFLPARAITMAPYPRGNQSRRSNRPMALNWRSRFGDYHAAT